MAQAFVAAAGTLGDDVDTEGSIARLASGCRSLLSELDCGVIARDADGELRSVASSPAHLRLVQRIMVPYDLTLSPASDMAQRTAGDTAGALLQAEFNLRTFVKPAQETEPGGGAGGDR